MKAITSRFRPGSVLAILLGASIPVAHADLDDPRILALLSPFEQRAALANQAVYDNLTTDPDGPNGPQLAPCSADVETGLFACSGTTLSVFENTRELVQTSNELLGSGPTTYSLGLDPEGLGFALRWTAAEELAAQGASATDFSNSQLGALSTRLTALRFGARGFRVANRTTGESEVLAFDGSPALGGGAAADGDSIASRWSAFLDGSFGYGNKEDTTFAGGFEDAFDFDGQEITLGLDRRMSDSTVLGVMGGYSDKAIDFDSSRSIVDAQIDVDGYSVMLYALWESDNLYLNGSIGGQWLDLDTTRKITYPSFNPVVPSVNATAVSATKSSAITATFGVGYDARWKGLTVGPYLKADYQDITIDGFTEGGLASQGFGFRVGSQDIKSLDTAVGLRVQYVITPSFGVLVPYLRTEYHRELEDDPRTVSALYAGASSLTSASDFALTTDAPDDDYGTAAAGMSVVLKHGLQGYLQYQQVFSLDTFTDRVITGGVRYEF